MEYIPVRLNTLRPDATVLFDVYISIAGKQIHYGKKSEILLKDRLEKLKQKGVKKLFVKLEEEELYLKYLDEGLNSLAQNDLSLGKKGEISYDTLVTDAENAERSLDTETGYKAVTARVGKIIEFIGSEKGTLKAILDSAGVALDDYQHGANVASLSTALALRVGKIPPREIGDLSLAALLHDIGKSKLGIKGSLNLSTLNPQAQKEYKKHTQMGVDMLSAKKYVTPTVLRLIGEHEELAEGKGYPERRNLLSLNPTSQILSLCNQFDCYSMQNKTQPVNSFKTFFQDRAQLFDAEHLAILGELLEGK